MGCKKRIAHVSMASVDDCFWHFGFKYFSQHFEMKNINSASRLVGQSMLHFAKKTHWMKASNVYYFSDSFSCHLDSIVVNCTFHVHFTRFGIFFFRFKESGKFALCQDSINNNNNKSKPSFSVSFQMCFLFIYLKK